MWAISPFLLIFTFYIFIEFLLFVFHPCSWWYRVSSTSSIRICQDLKLEVWGCDDSFLMQHSRVGHTRSLFNNSATMSSPSTWWAPVNIECSVFLLLFCNQLFQHGQVVEWSRNAAGVNFRVDIGEGEFLEGDVVGEVFLSLVDKHAEPQEQVLGQQFSQTVSIVLGRTQPMIQKVKMWNLSFVTHQNSPIS